MQQTLAHSIIPVQNSTSNVTTSTHDSSQNSALFTGLLTIASPFLTTGGMGADFLRISVVGKFLDFFALVISSIGAYINNMFWITVQMQASTDSFDWIMIWLKQHPSWSNVRNLTISTRHYRTGPSILPEDEDDNERKMTTIPSEDYACTLWYKGHIVRLVRTTTQKDSLYLWNSTLTIKVLGFNQKIVKDLLIEAKAAWQAIQTDNVVIYGFIERENWVNLVQKPKRQLRSIFLDEGVQELLLADAKEFLESKEWYRERGIPFQRGYLLYGAPGSGKTSIIHSLAGELNLDVYNIPLSAKGLDDSVLQTLMSELPDRCIAIMEDLDAAFRTGVTRDAPADQEKEKKENVPRISFSGLLNILDGVGAQEGRLLFATTNRYEDLDEALRRPGRMDLHVEFRLASKSQAQNLFNFFYVPSDPKKVSSPDEGYGTLPITPTATSIPDGETETEKLVNIDPPLIEAIKSNGLHLNMKKLEFDPAQIKELAEQFASAIPERKFSMAELQGYLMGYKLQPFKAVEDVKKWVSSHLKKSDGEA